jgi:hypothetical protein
MKKSCLFIASFFLCLPVAVFAQKSGGGPVEADYGIFQTQKEYFQFMGDIKESVAQNPEMKKMIPMINDMVLGRPMGWSNQKYGGEGTTFGLLSSPKIREDLEMIDSQYEKLQQVYTQIQKRSAEQLRKVDFNDPKNMTVYIRKIREEAEKDLEKALLPHQLKRLQQLNAQSQLRWRSLAGLLTSEPFKTRLEISEDQSDELQNAEEEIERELEKKIAKLRSEAREELISNLKQKQRDQVKELFGDAFEFSDPKKSKEKPLKRKK